jgi:hypothetical protein
LAQNQNCAGKPACGYSGRNQSGLVLRACCRERRQLQRMSHSYYLAGLLFDGRELRHNPSLRVYLTNVVGVLLINLATPLGFVIADPREWQRFSEWIAR